ncbi:TPA: hypothetical protein ACWWET_000007 [Enterococcus faecalis]|jgi:hypothetical protein|nr:MULTISPECIES: hypothetical protein [Enterococcus]MDK0525133.1 hypothetical protein [Enterococcus faecalis]MDN3198197.1 hypothetical protein [Enterococcus faecalis]MDQ8609048.1 hypothetical protein [Enterococcus sp. FR088]UYY35043.1 hypothetical protein OLL95_09340 [Enterococcus faecalis]UYY37862.1 hypothetical protein OLL92_09340 [Enterococcus faecalis]
MELFMKIIPLAMVLAIVYWLVKVSKVYNKSEYAKKNDEETNCE